MQSGIHEMQNSTHLLIPKLSFQLLVKDILKEMEAKEEERGTSSYKGELHTNLPEDPDLGRNRFAVRMETHALLALHEAAEMYLVGILEEKQSYESRDVCQKDIVLKSMCPVLQDGSDNNLHEKNEH
eukprot:s2314_g1.t1